MKPQNRLVEFTNSSFGFGTCFLGALGGGADDDDIVTQTPRNNISRRAVSLGIYSTFVMSDHCISSPNRLLDVANSTWGFRRAFGKNSNLVGGKLFRG